MIQGRNFEFPAKPREYLVVHINQPRRATSQDTGVAGLHCIQRAQSGTEGPQGRTTGHVVAWAPRGTQAERGRHPPASAHQAGTAAAWRAGTEGWDRPDSSAWGTGPAVRGTGPAVRGTPLAVAPVGTVEAEPVG